MFDLAIDSKLRGCDVVKVKIADLVSVAPSPPCLRNTHHAVPIASSFVYDRV